MPLAFAVVLLLIKTDVVVAVALIQTKSLPFGTRALPVSGNQFVVVPQLSEVKPVHVIVHVGGGSDALAAWLIRSPKSEKAPAARMASAEFRTIDRCLLMGRLTSQECAGSSVEVGKLVCVRSAHATTVVPTDGRQRKYHLSVVDFFDVGEPPPFGPGQPVPWIRVP
jgi:hypothetical protein